MFVLEHKHIHMALTYLKQFFACSIILSKEEVYKMADKKDDIVTSEDLRKEINEERKQRGEYEIPAINPGQSGISFGTLARKDKSWDNFFDFAVKLFKGEKKK